MAAPLGVRATLILGAYLLGLLGVLVAGVVIAQLVIGVNDTLAIHLLAGVIPVFSGGAVAVIVWQLRRHGAGLSSVGLHRPSWRMLHLIWQIPANWVLLLLSIAVMLPVLERFGDPATGSEDTMAQVGIPMAVAVFIGTAVLTPVWEEMLFRGIIHQGLRSRFTMIRAMLLSSLIFAAVHVALLMVLYFLVMGLALAFLVEFHKNLWASIIGHAAINVPVSGAALLAVL